MKFLMPCLAEGLFLIKEWEKKKSNVSQLLYEKELKRKQKNESMKLISSLSWFRTILRHHFHESCMIRKGIFFFFFRCVIKYRHTLDGE